MTFSTQTHSVLFFQEESKIPDLGHVESVILKNRLKLDYKLYNHFYRKFDDLVKNFGVDKMNKEVRLLDDVSSKLQIRCGFEGRKHNKGRSDRVSFVSIVSALKVNDLCCVVGSKPGGDHMSVGCTVKPKNARPLCY